MDEFNTATITLLPPSDGQHSDEDSGGEEGTELQHLCRNQLIAEAELEIDYGSHVESSFNPTVVEVADQPPRRSSRLNTSISSNAEGTVAADLSADLWAESQELLEMEVFNSALEKHWLSGQVPPSPPTVWLKRDLVSKYFSNPPEERTLSSNQCATPYSMFNLFFDDEVVDHIVEMTNLYARRDKNLVNFRTSNSEIRVFLAILLLSGFTPRPRARMYWEACEVVGCAAVSKAMNRGRFENLMACFHLADNLTLEKGDKMAKVRPFYRLINERCLQNRVNAPNLSVDEAMLPYFGRNSSKQRIQNKPVRVGYKMWVLAESTGYVVQFDPYQGAKSSGPTRSSVQTWGLGEKTVLELLEVLPKGPSYHVYMDNFFTSVRLMKFLGQNNIKASGTLRQNRLAKSCQISKKVSLQKCKRGHSEQQTAEDSSATVVAWKDNKVVFFTSNCDSTAPEVSVERYCRDTKERISVKQPQSINNYNKSMGGVDRADQNIAAYRISIRSKKWWWPLFAWVPDMAIQNAWVLYRKYKEPSDPSYDLLSFKREIVSVYLKKYATNVQKPDTSEAYMSNKTHRVPISIRLDKQGHFSEPCPTTKRCGLCGKNTRKWCPKCSKGVHDRCFNAFHGF